LFKSKRTERQNVGEKKTAEPVGYRTDGEFHSEVLLPAGVKGG